MSWKATKNFYDLNRKFITADGTFLSGPNKGTLLVAIAQDAKEQLMPLAFSIVESGNSVSWKFFLGKLNETFNINNNQTLLMSDRDLGLLAAVSTISLNIIKCNCIRHLAKNLKERFRDKSSLLKFYVAAYTYDEAECNQAMEELSILNPGFYNACISSNIAIWANSKCPLARYEKNTSNSAESMNSAIKKFITNDITNLIASLNNYNMKKFIQRRNKSSSFYVFPKQIEKVESNIAMDRLYSTQRSINSIFLVDSSFIVN
jgi:hypothetical protein